MRDPCKKIDALPIFLFFASNLIKRCIYLKINGICLWIYPGMSLAQWFWKSCGRLGKDLGPPQNKKMRI